MTAIIEQKKISEEVELDADLGYGKLLSAIIRRRFWFLATLGGALSLATIVALLQKPVYESTFQLLIESVYRSKESDVQNLYEELNVEVENYATQLEVMRSSELLKKAQLALKSEYPNLELEDLEDNFDITQVQGDDYEDDRVKTTVFEAEYTDDDPKKTKKVLETIIQVYQDYTLEQQQARLAQGLSFIDAQLPIARQKVTEAENALEKFRKNNNLINPDRGGDSASADLKDVRAQKRQVEVNYQNTLAQYNDLQDRLQRTPQGATTAARLSQSSRFATLLEAVQKTELALNARESRFTSNDPLVQDLSEQLQKERSMLEAEAQNVLGVVPEDLDLTQVNLVKEGQLGENDLKSAEQLTGLKTQLDSLKAQEKALVAAEKQLQAKIDSYPSLIAEFNRLKPEVDVRRATVQQLLTARQKLGIEIDRGGLKWQVVEAPDLGEDETPSKLKTLLAGLVVGSFLGVGTALGREALDDVVHSSQQLEQESNRALLGVIPNLPDDSIIKTNLELLLNQFADSDRRLDASSFTGQPVAKDAVSDDSSGFDTPKDPPISWQAALDNAGSFNSEGEHRFIEQTIYLRPLRESLDLIYQNIKRSSSAEQNKSLLITSVETGVDSLTLLLGLAYSAVRANQKVLIVDTDFRFSTLQEKLNIEDDLGLSDLLVGEVTDAHIQTVSLLAEEIDVLIAGTNVNDPIKLLNNSRLKELMYVFERNYDLVLLTSPPVLGYVDMLQTAQCCQGVALVEQIDRITKSKLSEANGLLDQINVLGIVAYGGESSDAKLKQTYQPQWESMFKELPPARTSS